MNKLYFVIMKNYRKTYWEALFFNNSKILCFGIENLCNFGI